MNRRELIVLGIGAAMASPLGAHCQEGTKVPRMARVGFFTPQSPNPPWIEAFRTGLREHGYFEGRNAVVELRSADGKKENYPRMMAELFAFKPDVLMTWSTPTSVALKQATSTIPIVSISGDPVGLGLAESLAHPKGNLTGFSIFSIDLEAKQVQLLKDTLAGLSSIAVLSNPTNQVNQPIVESIRRAATRAGMSVQVLLVDDASRLAESFDAAVNEGSGALLILRDDLFDLNRKQIAVLAEKKRLPIMAGWGEYAQAGCLMTYGVNFSDLFRRAAWYVDRILKGTAPGDLPIAQPEKFELIVNLKTARAFGLQMPPTLLATADEVIE
jgi:putative tryptophan/tyrosine transport system substrate-binding protein